MSHRWLFMLKIASALRNWNKEKKIGTKFIETCYCLIIKKKTYLGKPRTVLRILYQKKIYIYPENRVQSNPKKGYFYISSLIRFLKETEAEEEKVKSIKSDD